MKKKEKRKHGSSNIDLESKIFFDEKKTKTNYMMMNYWNINSRCIYSFEVPLISLIQLQKLYFLIVL